MQDNTAMFIFIEICNKGHKCLQHAGQSGLETELLSENKWKIKKIKYIYINNDQEMH